ncbi:MAG: ribonuclease D [Pseudomonadota bacterium]
MKIITNSLELTNLCSELQGNKYIAIDTEFFRQNTYYPKLCLLQLATESEQFLIDPLINNLDLSPLDEVLQNDLIVKIFHSAKQDLEILYQVFKRLPKNIFDTQIAASFCGFGLSISYDNLVKEFFGIQLDKSLRISDWRKRPLLKSQIDYAIGDVTYLYDIYIKLIKLLEKNNYLDWANEEMLILSDPNTYIVDLDQVWRKIKSNKNLCFTPLLKNLAAWREMKAQEKDLPRNHFLHENDLIKLVETIPLSLLELKKTISIKEKYAIEIIEVIKKTLKEDEVKDIKNNNLELLVELKSLLKNEAEAYRLPPQLIATSSELKSFANGLTPNPRFLSGWRYNVIGAKALKSFSRNK